MRRQTDPKKRARYETQVAIRGGEVERKHECEICGSRPAHCHHIDYADPLRVMWLCPRCHMQTHSQFGRPAPADWMADIRTAVARIDAQRLALRAASGLAAHPDDDAQAASNNPEGRSLS
jgi:hypothetical protein